MNEDDRVRGKRWADGCGGRFLVPDEWNEEQLAFRVAQVAKMLSCPRSTMYDLVKRKAIRSIRIGRGPRAPILILREEIDRLLRR